jgi:hypothetical protein
LQVACESSNRQERADERNAAVQTPKAAADLSADLSKVEPDSSADANSRTPTSAGVPERGATPSPPPKVEEAAPLPGYLLGDPPYVEGYDPEEQTCVRGDWCGDAALARPLAAPGAADHPLGCPDRLLGRAPGEVDFSQAAYAGLSSKRAMRANFQSWNTERERRSTKKSTLCCYHWFNYCAGRPLGLDLAASQRFDEVDSGEVPPPSGQRHPGWIAQGKISGEPCERRSLGNDERAALIEHILADADDEHASIAAFARAIVELLAVGAPAELIVRHQQALADEIGHAQALYSQAARLGATRSGPREVPAPMPRAGGLAALIRHTFLEACVGETIAALRAKRQARAAADPEYRSMWERISVEESDHAALGWQTVVWGLAEAKRRGILGVDDELRELALRVGEEIAESAQTSLSKVGAGELSPRTLAPILNGVCGEFGLLRADEIFRCVDEAFTEIIAPTVAAIASQA